MKKILLLSILIAFLIPCNFYGNADKEIFYKSSFDDKTYFTEIYYEETFIDYSRYIEVWKKSRNMNKSGVTVYVDPNHYTFEDSYGSGEITISVEGGDISGNVKVTLGGDWLTIVGDGKFTLSSGSNTKITFNAALNASNDTKTGEITVYPDGLNSHIVYIHIPSNKYRSVIKGETYPLNNPNATYFEIKELGELYVEFWDPLSIRFTDEDGKYELINNEKLDNVRIYFSSPDFLIYQWGEFESTIHHSHTYQPVEQREYNFTFPDNYTPGHPANVLYNLSEQKDWFDNTYPDHAFLPIIKIFTNSDLGGDNGQILCNYFGCKLKYTAEAGKFSHAIRHEYSHYFVIKHNEDNFLNSVFGDDEEVRCMDEAFAWYFPAVAMNDPIVWLSVGEKEDISVKLSVNNKIGDDLDETDHAHYHNQEAVASAWWAIKQKIGTDNFNQLLFKALVNIDSDEVTPRDFYNQLLIEDDLPDDNPADLTPHFDDINDAYVARGMYYYPEIKSVDHLGNEKNKYEHDEDIYVKIWPCPTNEYARVYIVEHNDNWESGDNLNDISEDDYKVVWIRVTGAPAESERIILVWGVSATNERTTFGDFDVIVDVNRNGKYDFDFDGRIDGISTIKIKCPPPSGQMAENITSQTAQLSWTENDVATAWRYMLVETGIDTTGKTKVFTSNNPYPAYSLTPNTSYDWYIQSYCGAYLSNWVGPHTFKTRCYAPSGLSASDVDTISATLSWSGTASSWQIIISSSSFDPTGMSGAGASNPYQVSGLSPSTTYYWAVRAVCQGGGYSFWTGPTSFTTADPEDDEAEFLVEFFDSGQQLGTTHHTAIALGDLDGDGDLDAAVTTDEQNQPNRVWLNDGNGNFTDSGLSFGWDESWDIAFGDLDGDGDLDGFIANEGPNKVYLNDGIYTTDNGQSLGNAESHGISLADLDGDGDLDAAIANSGSSEPNKIWLNDGYGNFTAYSMDFGIDESWDVALGDLDGDYDVDGFVVNDGANKVYINNGSSTSDNGQNLGTAFSKGVLLRDLDDDGDLDAFVANSSTSLSNSVWLNDGSANFTDSGFDLGENLSRCLAIGDLDADDDLDAFIANDGPNMVYLDIGLNPLDNFQELGTANSYGVALGDLDGDGDLDAFVANYDGPCKVWLNNSDEYIPEPASFSEIVDKPVTPWNLNAIESPGRESPGYVLENHPDPFKEMTRIKFEVEKTAMTILKVCDSYGKVVTELYHGKAEAGEAYFFTIHGEQLPEGMYILYLQSGDRISAKEKMLLIK